MARNHRESIINLKMVKPLYNVASFLYKEVFQLKQNNYCA